MAFAQRPLGHPPDEGRLRPGDHAYVPFYVGSREGLFVSDRSAKKGYVQLRNGLDWLNPCKK